VVKDPLPRIEDPGRGGALPAEFSGNLEVEAGELQTQAAGDLFPAIALFSPPSGITLEWINDDNASSRIPGL
jgi:hypothetical protein